MARRSAGTAGLKRVAPCVYKRGSKYVVAISNPACRGGKQWVGTYDSYRDALEARDAARANRRRRGSRETCNAMAERWLEDRADDWEASTASHNRQTIHAFVDEFGRRALDDITGSEAMAWALRHRRHLPVVRAMFNHALRLGLAERNPFANLGLDGSRGRKDLVPLTEQELQALGHAARRVHGTYGPLFRAAVFVLAYVGCRPAELFALEHDDLDLSALTVNISKQRRKDGIARPKNKRSRTVVLPPPARDALLDAPRRLDVPWVFTTKTGKMLSRGSFRYAWIPVAALAGRPEMDPYELRHFCGSHLADLGASAQDIALQLGHTDGGQLAQRLYIHAYEDRARDRLLRAFGTNVTPLRPAGDGSLQEGAGRDA